MSNTNNHLTFLDDPVELAHIATTISETADFLFKDCEAFSYNIDDFRKGTPAEQGRKALAWMVEYYNMVRVSALNIFTQADILCNVLLSNNYVLAEKKGGEA